MSGASLGFGTLDPYRLPLDGMQLIEASAGTGKTYTIGSLVLRLLLEGPAGSASPPGIDQILVVTFTHAATGELRGRIRQRLSAALRQLEGGPPGEDPDFAAWLEARAGLADEAAGEAVGEGNEVKEVDEVDDGRLRECRQRLRQALRDFDDAAIFTIHGFCQRMLRDYAFESGVDFDLELVGQETTLRRTAVQDYWARVTYDAPELAVAWLWEDGKLGLKEMDALGKGMAGSPLLERVPGIPEPKGSDELSGRAESRGLPTAAGNGDADLDVDAIAASESDCARAWASMADAWRADGMGALERLVEAAAAKQINGGTYREATVRGSWPAQIESLLSTRPGWPGSSERSLLGKLAAGHMKVNKGGQEPEHPLFDACADLLEALEGAEPALEAWGLQLRHGLDAWLKRELPERKRRARQQSFDDLLLQLHGALEGDGPDARRLAGRIRGRFKAALIDEFQDTDRVQYENFQRVFAPDAGSRGRSTPGADEGGSSETGAPDVTMLDDGSSATSIGGIATPLLLIGDPKQAIYAFRGADIFAYLEAVRRVGPARRHGLEVNFRSDRSLVEAVNQVWRRAELPFLFDRIPFHPVRARHEDRVEGAAEPLTLAYIPATVANPDDKASPVKADDAKRAAALAAATAVRHLLDSQQQLQDTSGRLHPVTAGDVAILVRENKQAWQMLRLLRDHRVPAVLHTDASVLAQPEAEEMRLILAALLEPAQPRRLRSALATPALGLDAREIDRLSRDERGWEGWIARFRAWQEAWRDAGILPALRRLIDEAGVARRLLELQDGERRLSNLLHLAELLQGVSFREDLGPESLVARYDRLCQEAGDSEGAGDLGDTAQLRLERDEAAVQVVTVHKAKGLEYPFVFCPFLWTGARSPTHYHPPTAYHDLDGDCHQRLDIGPELGDAGQRAARLEGLAEDLRLLYVAMTRARHGLWLALGPFYGFESSALAYLLQSGPAAGQRPEAEASAEMLAAWCDRLTEAAKANKKTAAEAESPEADPLWRSLAEIAESSGSRIAALRLAGGDLRARSDHPLVDREASAEASARQLSRPPRRRLYRSSFTALARGHRESHAVDLGEGGEDRDALQPSDPLVEEARAGEVEGRSTVGPGGDRSLGIEPSPEARVPLAELEAGTRLGTGLHALLEGIDFDGAPEDWRERAEMLVRRQVLPEAAVDPLLDQLEGWLRRPLGEAPLDFPLARLGWRDRIDEMAFVLPVALGSRQGLAASSAKAVGPKGIAAALEAHPGGQLPEDYPARLAELPARDFAGWLRGAIDLVFRYKGSDGQTRWYLLDWKSNRLGTSWDDYAPERLTDSMVEHHYFLQAHLYSLALHRHLRRHLEDYRYDQHFGGYLYLFLRGMHPDRPGSGLVFDRPPAARIEALDRLLRGRAEGDETP